MKRVLVTGAGGFIGRHCLPLLVGQAEEIHVVTHRTALPDTWPVIAHHADLLDPEQARRLVADIQPTHLMHLAWDTTPGDSLTQVANLPWLQSSLALMDAFSRHGGERVFVSGTCLEYDTRGGYLSEALTPMAPSTLYGACKHALHVALAALSRSHGLSYVWGRIFYVYGPHEDPRRLVPSVIRALLAHEPAQCTHGEQIRDYLHVQDVANAAVALLASDLQGPFNIASGQPVRLKEVIYAIARQLHREEGVQLGARPSRQDEPPILVAEMSHLFSQLDWRPAFSLETGLAETIRWWQTTQRRPHVDV